MEIKDTLFIIPARGGSKGIPRKNIKLLNGKPLIYYSIDVARALTCDENICISTDDQEIIQVVENYGLKVPFIRPSLLATDNATTSDVISHALSYYEGINKQYNTIILLQPTSPLRKIYQITEAMKLMTPEIDMVVSVKISHASAVICHQNPKGFLELTFSKNGVQRQQISNYYEYNGALYIINVNSFKKFELIGLTKIIKYIMPDIDSVDIDTIIDWKLCESIIRDIK